MRIIINADDCGANKQVDTAIEKAILADRITSTTIMANMDDFEYKSLYDNVFMAGSSKGGTVALFYGLKNEVTSVFCGACQYNLGTYLSSEVHTDIFKSMMGGELEHKITLNNIIKDVINKEKGQRTKVFVFYSKNEPTYEEEIVDLLHALSIHHYDVIEGIENFEQHGDVGKYFPSFVISNLKVYE